MRWLALALLSIVASCNTFNLTTPTNLRVADLKVISIGSFPPDQVIAFEVVVENKNKPGLTVAAARKLRVTAHLRIEDPNTFDPDNPPAPQLDANGDPVQNAAMVPLHFTPAKLLQPPGTPTPPPVVLPGERGLVVDLVKQNGQALFPGDAPITIQTVGFVWNPWPNPGERRVYLEVWVTRHPTRADLNPSNNFEISMILLPPP
jgi:hypothetical protein